MKFEEKKIMEREEIGKLLAKIGKKMEEKGVLDFGKGEYEIPESLDVKIEYKKKHDKRKFEIELEWYLQLERTVPVPTAIPSPKDVSIA
ncbi:MAG: amphi-Trp domain-containing protein [Candidatus Hydrothermarchaeaceae archaeon]